MNHKYCDSCGQQVMASMRICNFCGNRSFRADPPQSNQPTPIPSKPVPSPHPNLPVKVAHQPATIWNRVWARGIDLTCASIIGTLVINILPSVNLFESYLANFLVDIVVFTIVLWILITLYDAMFLSTWGSSPGKAMMGLYLRDSNGLKLTAGLAHRRARILLHSGLSYMFFYPFLQFVNLYYIIKNNSTKWDNGEYGVVLQRPISNVRRIAVVILSLTVILADFGAHQIIKELNKQELRTLIRKT